MRNADVIRDRRCYEKPRGLKSAARFMFTALAAQIFFLTITSSGDARTLHPFHTTTANAEMNLKTGRLEVALRVFPDDLERAIARRVHKPVSLEKTPNVDKLILEYLKTIFVIQPARVQEATSELRTSVRAESRMQKNRPRLRDGDAPDGSPSVGEQHGDALKDQSSATPSAARTDRAHLSVTSDNPQARRAPIRWVGKEVLVKSAWLYFEVSLPKGLDQAQVSNRIFFETQARQINTVVFKQGKFTTSVQFAVKAPSATIAIPESK